ncbi:hypothetical protein WISP_66637 [Willisornis vidua]|uniref:Reverse transcriptase domain-containing protein n=1 Tax=Willisornis vidua TaxID=1566151 RepID=A0ABQ9DER3_9PASS|nr:hypothetical protein WISP_66637 [Willisornis vidua]
MLLGIQVEEEDDPESRQEEKEEVKCYSRRKIFSNWSRYEDTEKEGQRECGETQRGTDFSVLLSSAARLLTLSHNILRVKLRKCRLDAWMGTCIENWLNSRAQSVVISGTESSWRLVANSVPQRSVLAPVWLNLLISNLDEATEYTLSKFADTKVGVDNTLECCAAIQCDLGRLESWAESNQPNEVLQRQKCKILHLGKNNPMHQYGVGWTY